MSTPDDTWCLRHILPQVSAMLSASMPYCLYTVKRRARLCILSLSLSFSLFYLLYISYPLYLCPSPLQAVSAKGGGLNNLHPKASSRTSLSRLHFLQSFNCLLRGRFTANFLSFIQWLSVPPFSNASADHSPTSPVAIASIRSIVGAGPGLEIPDQRRIRLSLRTKIFADELLGESAP